MHLEQTADVAYSDLSSFAREKSTDKSDIEKCSMSKHTVVMSAQDLDSRASLSSRLAGPLSRLGERGCETMMLVDLELAQLHNVRRGIVKRWPDVLHRFSGRGSAEVLWFFSRRACATSLLVGSSPLASLPQAVQQAILFPA